MSPGRELKGWATRKGVLTLSPGVLDDERNSFLFEVLHFFNHARLNFSYFKFNVNNWLSFKTSSLTQIRIRKSDTKPYSLPSTLKTTLLPSYSGLVKSRAWACPLERWVDSARLTLALLQVSSEF